MSAFQRLKNYVRGSEPAPADEADTLGQESAFAALHLTDETKRDLKQPVEEISADRNAKVGFALPQKPDHNVYAHIGNR